MTVANMSLGLYDFRWNPDKWTIPRADKFYGKVLTYTSVGYFSFGTSIIGKEILLEWAWMHEDQWINLEAMFQSDMNYIWTPGDGNSYDVEILNLDGAYFENVALNAKYRKDVKLILMVNSIIPSS